MHPRSKPSHPYIYLHFTQSHIYVSENMQKRVFNVITIHFQFGIRLNFRIKQILSIVQSSNVEDILSKDMNENIQMHAFNMITIHFQFHIRSNFKIGDCNREKLSYSLTHCRFSFLDHLKFLGFLTSLLS